MLRYVANFTEWLGKFVSFLVPLIIAIIAYEVAARYLFRAPTIWAHEMSQFIFGAYIILAGGYASLHNTHVRMDLLYSRFSPRRKAIIDLVGVALMLLFVGVMIWKGWEIAWSGMVAGKVSRSSWSPPMAPIMFVIPVASFLLLFQEMSKIVHDIHTVITGKDA